MSRVRLLLAAMAWPLAVGCLGESGQVGNSWPSVEMPGSCQQMASAVSDVSDAGPFRVGYRTFPHTYQAAGFGERTIAVHVWYPTEDLEGDGARYLDLWPDDDVLVDAAVAGPLDACGFPVLAYSHGHRAFGGSAAHLSRHFASHGWVTVAPDHTGNLLNDDAPRKASIYYLRSTDLAAAVDAVAGLADPDPLAGQVAVDRVVVAGHSFGTHTMWATSGASFAVTTISANCDTSTDLACTDAQLEVFADGVADDRIVGAIHMDGTMSGDWFDPDSHRGIQTPQLVMTGAERQAAGQDQFEQRGVDLEYTWLDFANACHETFAGAQWFGCDDFDIDDGYKLVDAYALAFARHYLLNDQSQELLAILDGTTALSDKVTLQRTE